MKLLKIALVHRISPRAGKNRMIGWWSYPVSGMVWDHIPVDKGFVLNRGLLGNDYDLIFYEDAKIWGMWKGSETIPIIYHIGDSVLSRSHYMHRVREGKNADLLLIEQDQDSRFRRLNKPIARFGYAVNDRVFKDYGMKKDVDVSFHCRTKDSPKRAELLGELKRFCEKRGYTFACGNRYGVDYAKAFNRSKITVNLNRGLGIRSHRIYDAMGCRTCVVSSPPPAIPDEPAVAGVHYLTYNIEYAKLFEIIDGLMDLGSWELYADAGYSLVKDKMNWRVRSQQLRTILMRFLVTDWARR